MTPPKGCIASDNTRAPCALSIKPERWPRNRSSRITARARGPESVRAGVKPGRKSRVEGSGLGRVFGMR